MTKFDPTRMISGPQLVHPPEPHGITVTTRYTDPDDGFPGGEATGIITTDAHYTQGTAPAVFWVRSTARESFFAVHHCYKLTDLPPGCRFRSHRDHLLDTLHGWEITEE